MMLYVCGLSTLNLFDISSEIEKWWISSWFELSVTIFLGTNLAVFMVKNLMQGGYMKSFAMVFLNFTIEQKKFITFNFTTTKKIEI